MNDRASRFLKAALGEAGAQALADAAQGALAPAALPRAALAWITVASERGWSGGVPGVGVARLELAKGEAVGTLSWGKRSFRFDSLEKGAAAVALAAGYDPSVKIEAPTEALVRLGKGVEALARGRFEQALEKADWYDRFQKEDRRVHLKKDGKRACKGPMFPGDKLTEDPKKVTCSNCKEPGEETKKAENDRQRTDRKAQERADFEEARQLDGHTWRSVSGAGSPCAFHGCVDPWNEEGHPYRADEELPEKFKKAEAGAPEVGVVAKPKEPGKPEAPAAPKTGAKPPEEGAQGTKEGTEQKPKRKTTLRLAKSAAERPCELCGLRQFRGGKFVGCAHFSELAKASLSSETAAGYVVELSSEAWDAPSVAALVRSFGGGE